MTGLYSFATLRCVYIVSAKRFILKAFIKCIKTLSDAIDEGLRGRNVCTHYVCTSVV